jgi:hypothetical protein
MSNHRANLIASTATFLILDTIAVGGRVYVRTKMITRGWGLDDYAMVVTYLGYVIHAGFHFTSMRYGYAAEDKQPYYDAAKMTQFYFANQLTIYITAGLAKIAVALILYRLASTKRMRWIIIISIIVAAIWTLVMTLFTSWLCVKNGASSYASSELCSRVGYFRTSSNIVIDYFYALLPIYLLWGVQMTRRLKLSVLFLLGLGIFASSATIVKLVVIIRLTTAPPKEAEAMRYDLLLWADIELGLAIFAASAAALRPLLKHLPGIWDTLRTPKSHNSNSDAVGPYREIYPGREMDRLSKQTGRTELRPIPTQERPGREEWSE